jgi:hypothetical protein
MNSNRGFLDFIETPQYCAETERVSKTAAKKQAQAASAVRTISRRQARYAKSEALLETLLPPAFAAGEAWHVLSSGDVDAMSYLLHIMRARQMRHVIFSTWCMAAPDVAQFGAWIDAGVITRLEAYVGEIFPNQYAAEYEDLCNHVAKTCGRVCTFKNHSKIILASDGKDFLCVESSANMNTNPRTENTVITHDRLLYEHHKNYFDKIHSFSKNFSGWAPA